MESLTAAVRCSADAVYFGEKTLNARRGAANFDAEQIKAAVRYCHARDVKAYLVLNTLVNDLEFNDVRGGAPSLLINNISISGSK